MILGIDCSTRCVGFCFLNDDGSLIDVDYVWLAKVESYYEKLARLKDALRNSHKIVSAPKIYVEAPLGRSNNINVVCILQRFNGMVCAMLYDLYGVEPKLIRETEVRKINKIKVPKGVKGLEKKKYCLKIVQEHGTIPESKWELKRTGNPKDFSYDMADAYLVARAGFLK